MKLPKGNPLIEDVALSFSDVDIMLTNLEQDLFTGYVRLALGSGDCYVFFDGGNVVRAVESQEKEIIPRTENRILNLVKRVPEARIYTYVASSSIVSILSSAFAFKQVYMDYQVRRKDLRKVLSGLEQDEMSGILFIKNSTQQVYLLMQEGHIVTERFVSGYGDILCGDREVNQLLDQVYNEGATIRVYAERASVVERKKRLVEEELEKIVQLIVRSESGILRFRTSDVVFVPEDVVVSWGLETGSTFVIEVETCDGELHNFKARSTRKWGGHVSFHTNMLKTIGVSDGDLVNVRPV